SSRLRGILVFIVVDARETYNENHGYTLVEHTEEDGFGKKYSRRFYPRIRQHIKTYKKMLPMKITYNKLTVDETGVVEEEDVINEEMEVEETTNTILVKMRNERGEEITVEKEVMHTNIHDPSVKKKFLKLRMVNDEGEVVEELVELNDDNKRTNEILKAAGPYVKKRPKDKSTSIRSETCKRHLVVESTSLPRLGPPDQPASTSCIHPAQDPTSTLRTARLQDRTYPTRTINW
ncbi:hypothetical protein GE061_005872, partial [Apolygus lucorum]